ncbi:hypothetical protein VOLCADRAFT_100676, partial [Volvox carteri f. nagariensis]
QQAKSQGTDMPKANRVARQPRCTVTRLTRACNRAFQAAKGKVASDGGSAVGLGFSGSLCATAMARIICAMAEAAGFGMESIFVDVGCGLGRPLVAVSILAGAWRCVGLDMDVNKLRNADVFIRHCAARVPRRLRPESLSLVLGSVGQVGILPLGPEYFYLFWEGWSVADKMALAALFMRHGSRKVCKILC